MISESISTQLYYVVPFYYINVSLIINSDVAMKPCLSLCIVFLPGFWTMVESICSLTYNWSLLDYDNWLYELYYEHTWHSYYWQIACYIHILGSSTFWDLTNGIIGHDARISVYYILDILDCTMIARLIHCISMRR